MKHETIFNIHIYEAKDEEAKCQTTYGTGRGGGLARHDVLWLACGSGQ